MRPQPFDSDVPPEKAGSHLAMIEGGEHADRAHDMPILLDQTGVGIETAGDIFNEAPVQHVRSSGELRYS